MTLDEFRSNVKSVARTNRFLVEFSGPTIDKIELPTRTKFLANKATVPKKDVNGPVIKFKGNSMMLTGDFKKEPLTIGFLNDETWKTRRFFEVWMHLLFNSTDRETEPVRTPMSQTRFGNSIKVIPLGSEVVSGEGKKLRDYEFFNVVPVELSSIELDMGTADQLQEYTVQFQYSHWNIF
jgi:hypothetical protein